MKNYYYDLPIELRVYILDLIPRLRPKPAVIYYPIMY